jgi:hypothetical protein
LTLDDYDDDGDDDDNHLADVSYYGVGYEECYLLGCRIALNQIPEDKTFHGM